MRKGQKPSQHWRRIKTKRGRKKIPINPHIRKKKKKKVTKVGKYDRHIKGKVYKIKPHKRTQRSLGKKISYTYVGDFLVGHDELGNFRGSRIRKPKKTRKRVQRYQSMDEIDTDYYTGALNQKEWLDAQTKFMKLM